MKITEYSKEAARIYYPEIFDLVGGVPGNFETAYDIFCDHENEIEGFKDSFEFGEEGWCDVYETETGEIAVYGVGALTCSTPLHIIEL